MPLENRLACIIVSYGGLEHHTETAGQREEIPFAEYTSCIREIHHRVKNNLQVIVSLFSLQEERITDPQVLDMLAGMQNRVRAIAYLHEPLYSAADFSAIHFGEYLHSLIRELHAFYRLGNRVRLELSLADLVLDIADAVPLALICNELVSNALKYAFPENRTGNIAIALRSAPGEPQNDESQFCEVQIRDDGVGLQETDPCTAESMGFRMVRLLLAQLRGKLDVHSDRTGTSLGLVFPMRSEQI